MAACEEMALRREVIKWVMLGAVLLLALPFLPSKASAAIPHPILLETDWRTGEIMVSWTNATPGTTMMMYAATHENHGAYEFRDAWVVHSETGSYVTQFLENGQTVWYYVRLYDPVTQEWSDQSNELKQTPPETVFVINWPDMFNDLKNAMQAMNDDMKRYFDKLFTPSDQAINDLKDAVDGIKNAVGAGDATNAGNQLVNGLNNMQGGMSPPVVRDDGNGTYTGGSTGGQLPSTPGNVDGNGMHLVAPDPDSGTDTEMTMRIPIGIHPDGSLYYIKLFTKEQMEKMKWFGLIRELAGITIFIIFGIWLTARFAPQLKS